MDHNDNSIVAWQTLWYIMFISSVGVVKGGYFTDYFSTQQVLDHDIALRLMGSQRVYWMQQTKEFYLEKTMQRIIVYLDLTFPLSAAFEKVIN